MGEDVNGNRPDITMLTRWALEALPVLAAVLLAAFSRQQAEGAHDWAAFALHCVTLLAVSLPLLAAHIAAGKLRGGQALLTWLAGFLLFPATIAWAQGSSYPVSIRDWSVAAGFSAATLLGRTAQPRSILSALRRLPVTLDAAITSLVAVFVLTATSMFASVDDPVNNQPFTTWFDPGYIVTHPLTSLSYFSQFIVMGALVIGFYWCCRHVLIRWVLRNRGWAEFLFASLAFWILYTPIASSLVLLLPLNGPDWSLLPSENHNPFDPLNYALCAAIWVALIPLILVSERLLAERAVAIGRHDQVRAELHMLHQQINPHFLFNALNTLYALALRDRETSAGAIVKLSDLLRYAVYQGDREQVGLDEEIAYLRNYIDLQLLRFGQRCRVTSRWPQDPDRYCIPPMLLIMLVENAFKHGVEPCDGESHVEIAMTLSDASMYFTCRNSLPAPGFATGGAGVGLANLRRRLELLIGNGFSLSSVSDGDSWQAELIMELRPC